MKKILLLVIIFSFSTYLFSQANSKDSTSDDRYKNLTLDDLKKEYSKFRNELDAVKKDIDILKERTEWFTFNISGYVKVIYGVNVWSRLGYTDSNGNVLGGFDTNHPITHGFDYENRIHFKMNLGNKIIASSKSEDDLGTEIGISLKIQSLGISDLKPSGNYYSWQAYDDQGNITTVYAPRMPGTNANGDSGSNVVFGNFLIVLDEAKVKNILGTGFFVNYSDVKQVATYYGATGLADSLILNNEYFNNGFVLDSSNKDKVATLYYSFDPQNKPGYDWGNYYTPECQVSQAMSLWSNDMLQTNPNDPFNSKINQSPHGISFGYDSILSGDKIEGAKLYLEAGAASKDAFDPKYYEDQNIDYGFFIKAEPKFYNAKFMFDPKLNISYAFQTQTTQDEPWPWSTFAAALALPISYNFNKTDKFKLELDYDLNVNIVTAELASLVSFSSEFTFLNNKMNISLPIIYSFKNNGGSGFQRIGNEDSSGNANIPGQQYIDQLYDDHILNLGFITTFDSRNLLGDIFEYKVTNKIYYTLMAQYGQHDNPNNPGGISDPEQYFFEILRNEIILNNLNVHKLSLYIETGLGYLTNAKMVDSTTNFGFIYNREHRYIYVY